MASSIVYESRPKMETPIVIEGLPGVGNVAKIATDLIIDRMGAKRIARIFSDELPPQIFVNEECVAVPVCHEIWHAHTAEGKDVLILTGIQQSATPQGQYSLSEFEFNEILRYDPSLIITLGGYGTGTVVTDPRVLGAVSKASLKERMEAHGVGFYPNEPPGGIVGAAAMFVAFGQVHDIDAVCIMGETSGYVPDSISAKKLVEVLGSIFGMVFNTDSLQEGIDQVNEINAKALEQMSGNDSLPPEDLTYIR